MPSNACFSNMNSIGVPRLRRILRGLAWLYPEIGYCQGTGMVTCFQSVFVIGIVLSVCYAGALFEAILPDTMASR